MCGEYRAGSHANEQCVGNTGRGHMRMSSVWRIQGRSHANECGGVGSMGQGSHANEQCVGNEVALTNEIIAAKMSRTQIAVLMHVTSVCLSVYQSVWIPAGCMCARLPASVTVFSPPPSASIPTPPPKNPPQLIWPRVCGQLNLGWVCFLSWADG